MNPFPRPLRGLPECLELLGFRPAQVRALELELSWADADVVPLLLLRVKAAEAIRDDEVCWRLMTTPVSARWWR